jgi:hypothetical protein
MVDYFAVARVDFALTGKLAVLAYRPSREMVFSAVESSARGRVQDAREFQRYFLAERKPFLPRRSQSINQVMRVGAAKAK